MPGQGKAKRTTAAGTKADKATRSSTGSGLGPHEPAQHGPYFSLSGLGCQFSFLVPPVRISDLANPDGHEGPPQSGTSTVATGQTRRSFADAMSSPSPLCAASCSTALRAPPPLLRFRRSSAPVSASVARAAPAVSDDLVLRIAEQLEDSVTSTSPLLDPLRSASALSLLSTPWPTRRSSEAFRFTDISYLRSLPISLPSREPDLALPSSPFSSHVLFSDGILLSSSGAHVSTLADLPPGRARDRAAAALAASAEFAHKDLFYDFNAVGARDVVVVHVPEGVKMADDPIHILFAYTNSGAGSMLMSNPRVLVVAEKAAEVAIVEEHFGAGEEGGCYWANPVAEIIIDEGARVVHSYVQQQSFAAAHTKWTVVKQVSLDFR